ncbi:MAG: L,D-transpeptidase family protein [Candidatus Omnitrophota bacterium]
MDKINLKKIIIGACSIAVIVITVLSFSSLKKTAKPIVVEKVEETVEKKEDKTDIIFRKAEEDLKAAKVDEAVKAMLILINEYPGADASQKALRKLAGLSEGEGNYAKAQYYYKRLLDDFAYIKDAAKIRSIVEDINMRIMFSPGIAEGSIEYIVQSGDSLYAIARKFKTTVELIKNVNNLGSDLIRPGQRLKIIISEFSVFVDKARNILVLKKDGQAIKTYNVSTGKDNSTPVGIFRIEEKMVKPVWYKMNAIIDPNSDKYELGERWMGLSVAGYGIHGTSDETTIGYQVTQGCVRMYNKDVVELYDIVPSGTKVEIVDGTKDVKSG